MSDQSEDPLMAQITGAIQNIKDKITGYTSAAENFKGYVGGQTEQLIELIKRLRKCLEKLEGLKTSYESLIVKITSLEAQITTLTRITGDAATSAATSACNEKLTQILNLINTFAGTIGEFKDDAGALKGQVDELEKAIGDICKEADALVDKQGEAETATTNLETALGGEAGEKSQGPEIEEKEDNLPEGWEAVQDDDGNTYYYNRATNTSQWEKPESESESESENESGTLSLRAATKVAQAGERLKDRADVNLAQKAYLDKKDPNKLKMQEDMRNAQNPFDVMVDDPKYVAKNGRSKKWNVSWMNGPDRPMYSLAEGGTFNDGDGEKEETDKHPSEFENSMQGGKRKRKTRKKRGGWQTPDKLSSLSKTKPIRTLGYLKKKTKKRKNKKKKKKTRGRKRRNKHKKRTKRR